MISNRKKNASGQIVTYKNSLGDFIDVSISLRYTPSIDIFLDEKFPLEKLLPACAAYLRNKVLEIDALVIDSLTDVYDIKEEYNVWISEEDNNTILMKKSTTSKEDDVISIPLQELVKIKDDWLNPIIQAKVDQKEIADQNIEDQEKYNVNFAKESLQGLKERIVEAISLAFEEYKGLYENKKAQDEWKADVAKFNIDGLDFSSEINSKPYFIGKKLEAAEKCLNDLLRSLNTGIATSKKLTIVRDKLQAIKDIGKYIEFKSTPVKFTDQAYKLEKLIDAYEKKQQELEQQRFTSEEEAPTDSEESLKVEPNRLNVKLISGFGTAKEYCINQLEGLFQKGDDLYAAICNEIVNTCLTNVDTKTIDNDTFTEELLLACTEEFEEIFKICKLSISKILNNIELIVQFTTLAKEFSKDPTVDQADLRLNMNWTIENVDDNLELYREKLVKLKEIKKQKDKEIEIDKQKQIRENELLKQKLLNKSCFDELKKFREITLFKNRFSRFSKEIKPKVLKDLFDGVSFTFEKDVNYQYMYDRVSELLKEDDSFFNEIQNLLKNINEIKNLLEKFDQSINEIFNPSLNNSEGDALKLYRKQTLEKKGVDHEWISFREENKITIHISTLAKQAKQLKDAIEMDDPVLNSGFLTKINNEFKNEFNLCKTIPINQINWLDTKLSQFNFDEKKYWYGMPDIELSNQTLSNLIDTAYKCKNKMTPSMLQYMGLSDENPQEKNEEVLPEKISLLGKISGIANNFQEKKKSYYKARDSYFSSVEQRYGREDQGFKNQVFSIIKNDKLLEELKFLQDLIEKMDVLVQPINDDNSLPSENIVVTSTDDENIDNQDALFQFEEEMVENNLPEDTKVEDNNLDDESEELDNITNQPIIEEDIGPYKRQLECMMLKRDWEEEAGNVVKSLSPILNLFEVYYAASNKNESYIETIDSLMFADDYPHKGKDIFKNYAEKRAKIKVLSKRRTELLEKSLMHFDNAIDSEKHGTDPLIHLSTIDKLLVTINEEKIDEQLNNLIEELSDAKKDVDEFNKEWESDLSYLVITTHWLSTDKKDFLKKINKLEVECEPFPEFKVKLKIFKENRIAKFKQINREIQKNRKNFESIQNLTDAKNIKNDILTLEKEANGLIENCNRDFSFYESLLTKLKNLKTNLDELTLKSLRKEGLTTPLTTHYYSIYKEQEILFSEEKSRLENSINTLCNEICQDYEAGKIQNVDASILGNAFSNVEVEMNALRINISTFKETPACKHFTQSGSALAAEFYEQNQLTEACNKLRDALFSFRYDIQLVDKPLGRFCKGIQHLKLNNVASCLAFLNEIIECIYRKNDPINENNLANDHRNGAIIINTLKEMLPQRPFVNEPKVIDDKSEDELGNESSSEDVNSHSTEEENIIDRENDPIDEEIVYENDDQIIIDLNDNNLQKSVSKEKAIIERAEQQAPSQRVTQTNFTHQDIEKIEKLYKVGEERRGVFSRKGDDNGEDGDKDIELIPRLRRPPKPSIPLPNPPPEKPKLNFFDRYGGYISGIASIFGGGTLIAVGGFLSSTIFGAVVGVPLIILGGLAIFGGTVAISVNYEMNKAEENNPITHKPHDANGKGGVNTTEIKTTLDAHPQHRDKNRSTRSSNKVENTEASKSFNKRDNNSISIRKTSSLRLLPNVINNGTNNPQVDQGQQSVSLNNTSK